MAAAGALAVSVAGAFVSVWNAIHIGQVHRVVNGQAAKFESLAKQAGFAEGTRSNLKLAEENEPPTHPKPGERDSGAVA